MRKDVSSKAVVLAAFVMRLCAMGCLSASRARNILDRLALRMEQLGFMHTAEYVSTCFMRCR